MDIGVHFGYASRDMQTDYEETILKARRAGFDVLEASPDVFMHMTAERRRQMRELAADVGLKLTACLGIPPSLDPASTDEEIRGKAVRYLKDILRIVREMGADMLVGCSHAAWPYPFSAGLPERSQVVEQSVRSMKEVMKAAEDLGIVYAMEALNRFEQYIVNTAAEAVDYVRQVESPNLRILLDTFHMNIEEDSMEAAITTAGDLLADVHIGERNRRFPGQGDMPWERLLLALQAAHYDGPVVMEPFILAGGGISRDVYLWRDLSDGATPEQIDDMAAASVQFLRGIGY